MKALKIVLDVPSYIGIAFGSFGGLIFIASVMFEGFHSIEDLIFVPVIALPILGILVIVRRHIGFLFLEAICFYTIAKMALPVLAVVAESIPRNDEGQVDSVEFIIKSNDLMQDTFGGILVFILLAAIQFMRLIFGRYNSDIDGVTND